MPSGPANIPRPVVDQETARSPLPRRGWPHNPSNPALLQRTRPTPVPSPSACALTRSHRPSRLRTWQRGRERCCSGDDDNLTAPTRLIGSALLPVRRAQFPASEASHAGSPNRSTLRTAQQSLLRGRPVCPLRSPRGGRRPYCGWRSDRSGKPPSPSPLRSSPDPADATFSHTQASTWTSIARLANGVGGPARGMRMHMGERRANAALLAPPLPLVGPHRPRDCATHARLPRPAARAGAQSADRGALKPWRKRLGARHAHI